MSPRRLALFTFAALICLLAGCHDCPPPGDAIRRDDGGSYGCIRAEECPRDSTTLVCATTQPLEADCVDCRDGQCVLWPRQSCR